MKAELNSLTAGSPSHYDNEILIRVDGVSKKFCRSLRKSFWYGMCDIASELNPFRKLPTSISSQSSHSPSLRDGEFWAVKDVSFELRRGECLGLIGGNGAGKTTLLKMLNGLIKPDCGRIEMQGRVGALIALGVGFNPILTGRENIYVNAAVLGLRKHEIDAKMEEIIDFADIGDFIDTPVQSYSSGMQVRLGFSVAISLKPDILLIDEVLAVGDAGFRQKAYNAIAKVIENAAVIFVSHSIAQIARICNCGMLLRKGSMVTSSSRLEEVIDGYFREFQFDSFSMLGSGKARLLGMNVYAEGEKVLSLDFCDSAPRQGNLDLMLRHGQPVIFEILLKVAPEIRRFDVGLSFYDIEQKSVAQCSSMNTREAFESPGTSLQCIQLHLPKIPFNKGKYSVFVGIFEEHSRDIARGEVLAACHNLVEFQVSAHAILYGTAPVQLEADWVHKA